MLKDAARIDWYHGKHLRDIKVSGYLVEELIIKKERIVLWEDK